MGSSTFSTPHFFAPAPRRVESPINNSMLLRSWLNEDDPSHFLNNQQRVVEPTKTTTTSTMSETMINDNGKRRRLDHSRFERCSDEVNQKNSADEPKFSTSQRSSQIVEISSTIPTTYAPMSSSSRENQSHLIHPDRFHQQKMEHSLSMLIQHDAVNLPPAAFQTSIFQPAKEFPRESQEYKTLITGAIETELAKPAVRGKIMAIWSGVGVLVQEEVLFAHIAAKFVEAGIKRGTDYLEGLFAYTEEGTQRLQYETKQFLLADGFSHSSFI